MNKEQIDEVFNYALTENLKEIFSLVGMQNEYTDEPNCNVSPVDMGL